LVFKPSMCGCICAVYTSSYRIVRRHIGTNVDRAFRYRNGYAGPPVWRHRSVVEDAIHELPGRSYIAYSRPAIKKVYSGRLPQSIRRLRSLSVRTCEVFICILRLALVSRNRDTTHPLDYQRARRVGIRGPFSR
jgi:hypothetical protein